MKANRMEPNQNKVTILHLYYLCSYYFSLKPANLTKVEEIGRNKRWVDAPVFEFVKDADNKVRTLAEEVKEWDKEK